MLVPSIPPPNSADPNHHQYNINPTSAILQSRVPVIIDLSTTLAMDSLLTRKGLDKDLHAVKGCFRYGSIQTQTASASASVAWDEAVGAMLDAYRRYYFVVCAAKNGSRVDLRQLSVCAGRTYGRTMSFVY